MSNRIYLDYNSTSPFSKRLTSYLGKGDFPFANPSSTHSSGKRSRKVVNQTISFLFETFGLDESEYRLVFHSGSTEGIKTFFESAGANDGVFYCKSDHAAMDATAKELSNSGIYCETMEIDANGDLEVEKAVEKLKTFKDSSAADAFVNFLALNNETGVYWPLSLAEKIKRETGARIHVDATQLPGKIEGWNKLSPLLDVYTFSGHKFGSLKGIGFSFVRRDFPYKALIPGGGQQRGARGGTENALGVLSLRLALEDLLEADLAAVRRLRDDLQSLVLRREDALVSGISSRGRSLNTLNFVLKNKKADISLIQFDLAGLDVSSGSACSSGSVEPSPVLTAMGFGVLAKNGIRISLGPESPKQAQEIKEKFQSVLSRL